MSTLLGTNAVVREMFETRLARGPNDELVQLHSEITADNAEALYRTVLSRRPAVVIDVGMAFGVSALAILTALRTVGAGGKLISIDPFQSTMWKGYGVVAVRRAGLEAGHRLIEAPSYRALPRLLEAGQRIEFAYIDGMHTFDYALLDFWYIDKILDVGGVVGFNDSSFPSIHKVMGFVLTHRKYVEIDVGLARFVVDYGTLRGVTHPPGQTFIKSQDRYFGKQQSWEPNWDFFADF